MPLTNFRKDIDRIDEAIVRLLDERARVAKEIGHAKRTLELPLHNPGREQDVLRRLHALSDGSMPLANLDAIYRVVMAECLALQRADVASCRGQHNIGAGKIDAPAEIVENHEVAEGFFRMRLRNSALAGIFRPGQFFQLRPDAGQGECFLRRPFAPSAATDDGFTFIYAVVGSGTRALTRLAPGARVSVLAPLGNSYRLAPPRRPCPSHRRRRRRAKPRPPGESPRRLRSQNHHSARSPHFRHAA